jgi:hypothetical protein
MSIRIYGELSELKSLAQIAAGECWHTLCA